MADINDLALDASELEGAAPVPDASAPQDQPVGRTYTDDDIAAIRQQALQEAYSTFQQQAQAPSQADPLEAIAEQMYMDPAGALRAAMELQERRTMERLAPIITQVNSNTVVGELGAGLDDYGRQYIQKFAAHIDPKQVTPEVRDLMTRAARDYATEQKQKVSMREPAHATPTIQIDHNQFSAFNAERNALGLPPVSASEFQELSAL